MSHVTRPRSACGQTARMMKDWMSEPAPRRIVEHPDELGFRLVADALLNVMEPEDWYAIERAAVRTEVR